MSTNPDSKISLNLNAKPYVPKAHTGLKPLQPPQNSSLQHTSLNLAGSKPFIPKSRQGQIKPSSQPALTPSPAPAPAPAPAPKVKKVDREYFVIDEDDKQHYNFFFFVLVYFDYLI